MRNVSEFHRPRKESGVAKRKVVVCIKPLKVLEVSVRDDIGWSILIVRLEVNNKHENVDKKGKTNGYFKYGKCRGNSQRTLVGL